MHSAGFHAVGDTTQRSGTVGRAVGRPRLSPIWRLRQALGIGGPRGAFACCFRRALLALPLTVALWAGPSTALAQLPPSAAVAAPGVGGKSAHSADAARFKTGRLVVRVNGLPQGTRPAGRVRGPGVTRPLKPGGLTIARARPGRYVITVSRVRISRGWKSVKKGARAFPRRKRLRVTVKPGKTSVAGAAYGTMVNPGVTKAPRGLLSVVGDPASPSKLVYRSRQGLPARGAILTAAPSTLLPSGLVVKVTAAGRRGANTVLSVIPVPISAVVPTFDFRGGLELKSASRGRTTTRARPPGSAGAARSCSGPKDFDVGAKLDEFTIRRASSTLSPPQISFTVALRTTERFGPRIAAAGVSCSWDLAQLGPWSTAIPVFGVPIPVYATIPIKASASVEGSLSAFTLNLASTSVLSLESGKRNTFSFSQEGSNVWVNGVMKLSGSAKLSANMSLQLGVGNPKLGDLHIKAGITPKATWKTGAGCDVAVDLGSLSVGVKIGPIKGDTPPYSPFSRKLWHGCDGGSLDPLPGPGPQPGPGPSPGPGPQPGPGPSPQPQGFTVEDSFLGGTWARTDPNNGTWYSKSNRPANGAYWYPNGLGVGVDCARAAAGYVVRFTDGHSENWNTWFHVTDGKWFPSAAARETRVNGFYGLQGC